MAAELFVAVVVVPFDGRVLDRPVHPLDLAIGPRMVRFFVPMFDTVRLADHVEPHRNDDHATRPRGPDSSLETARSCPTSGEHLIPR